MYVYYCINGKHKLDWKWGHILSYVAHQYSRADFYSSLEVNLSLYYGGVIMHGEGYCAKNKEFMGVHDIKF